VKVKLILPALTDATIRRGAPERVYRSTTRTRGAEVDWRHRDARQFAQ
jgi:hypothetical protein